MGDTQNSWLTAWYISGKIWFFNGFRAIHFRKSSISLAVIVDPGIVDPGTLRAGYPQMVMFVLDELNSYGRPLENDPRPPWLLWSRGHDQPVCAWIQHRGRSRRSWAVTCHQGRSHDGVLSQKKWICSFLMGFTLWLFNIAMENHHF